MNKTKTVVISAKHIICFNKPCRPICAAHPFEAGEQSARRRDVKTNDCGKLHLHRWDPDSLCLVLAMELLSFDLPLRSFDLPICFFDLPTSFFDLAASQLLEANAQTLVIKLSSTNVAVRPMCVEVDPMLVSGERDRGHRQYRSKPGTCFWSHWLAGLKSSFMGYVTAMNVLVVAL